MSMFDSNDFLKLIQEGKISPDTITKDFTEALNAALAAKKQADEAAAKKKAEEEIKKLYEPYMTPGAPTLFWTQKAPSKTAAIDSEFK